MKKIKILSIIAGLFILAACSSSPVDKAASNDTPAAVDGNMVKVHYTLTVDDKVIDSSKDREPLAFTLGKGQVIPGFNNAVIGMRAGDKKSFTVSPAEGYGEINPKLFKEIPLSSLPEGVKPAPGMTLQAKGANGQMVPVIISAVRENTVVLNLNSPLAGKTLNFDIELMEIL